MLGGRVSVWVVPGCCVRRSVRKFAPCRPTAVSSPLLSSFPHPFFPIALLRLCLLKSFPLLFTAFPPLQPVPSGSSVPPAVPPRPPLLGEVGAPGSAHPGVAVCIGEFFWQDLGDAPQAGGRVCAAPPTLPPKMWPRAGGSAPATPVPRGSPVPIASDREKKSDFCNNYSISHFLGGFPPGEQLPGPGAGCGVTAPSDASCSPQHPVAISWSKFGIVLATGTVGRILCAPSLNFTSNFTQGVPVSVCWALPSPGDWGGTAGHGVSAGGGHLQPGDPAPALPVGRCSGLSPVPFASFLPN